MKKRIKSGCCPVDNSQAGVYKVESIISIDERGQMVLPKEIRDRLGIKAGDKLAVVIMGKPDKPCCISLIKTEELAEMVKSMLGPMMGEMGK